ncbi:DUF6292 family protein [Amycolatopsis sp. lyj-112]|uniref:DUF6292 family protein n=1 Tax=Amycolatopsis sp. lyj-112 TaxID=2789288 RepID=UPI0039795333
MELEFGETELRGLHGYVRSVIEALGLRGDAYYAQLEPIASVYIALEQRVSGCADRDVALVWDERHGWALAFENSSHEELIVIRYLGTDLLPSPRLVAEYTQEALASELPERLDAQPPVLAAGEGLAQRLAAYDSTTEGSRL